MIKNYRRDIDSLRAISEVGFEVPTPLARSIKFNKSKKLNKYTTSYDVYASRQKSINNTFKILENENKILLFDSSKLFYNIINKRCNYTLKEKSLYFDDDHLNRTRSEILIKCFLNHNINFAK